MRIDQSPEYSWSLSKGLFHISALLGISASLLSCLPSGHLRCVVWGKRCICTLVFISIRIHEDVVCGIILTAYSGALADATTTRKMIRKQTFKLRHKREWIRGERVLEIASSVLEVHTIGNTVCPSLGTEQTQCQNGSTGSRRVHTLEIKRRCCNERLIPTMNN